MSSNDKKYYPEPCSPGAIVGCSICIEYTHQHPRRPDRKIRKWVSYESQHPCEKCELEKDPSGALHPDSRRVQTPIEKPCKICTEKPDTGLYGIPNPSQEWIDKAYDGPGAPNLCMACTRTDPIGSVGGDTETWYNKCTHAPNGKPLPVQKECNPYIGVCTAKCEPPCRSGCSYCRSDHPNGRDPYCKTLCGKNQDCRNLDDVNNSGSCVCWLVDWDTPDDQMEDWQFRCDEAHPTVVNLPDTPLDFEGNLIQRGGCECKCTVDHDSCEADQFFDANKCACEYLPGAPGNQFGGSTPTPIIASLLP